MGCPPAFDWVEDWGMQCILKELIEVLEKDKDDYVARLKEDLQKALTNYLNRHETCCELTEEALMAIGFYKPNDYEDWLQWESPAGSNIDLGVYIDTGVVILWSQTIPITTLSDLKELIRLLT